VSKYGFVGSGVQKGVRRIFVVNGLETKAERRSESRRIMRAAFGQFKVYPLYRKGDVVGSAPVYMGKAETVKLVVPKDVNIGLFKPYRSKMRVRMAYQSPIPAPIKAGDHIADLRITAPGHADVTIPLRAERDIARKSAFGRVITALVQKIRG